MCVRFIAYRPVSRDQVNVKRELEEVIRLRRIGPGEGDDAATKIFLNLEIEI